MKKKISIIGSTGSIGYTTLNLLNKKNSYQVYILTGNNSYKRIIEQIKKFKPKIFIIFAKKTYLKVKKNKKK